MLDTKSEWLDIHKEHLTNILPTFTHTSSFMMLDFIRNFIRNHPGKIQSDPWTTNSYLGGFLSSSIKREIYII